VEITDSEVRAEEDVTGPVRYGPRHASLAGTGGSSPARRTAPRLRAVPADFPLDFPAPLIGADCKSKGTFASADSSHIKDSPRLVHSCGTRWPGIQQLKG
jgi:hypothetical protein